LELFFFLGEADGEGNGELVGVVVVVAGGGGVVGGDAQVVVVVVVSSCLGVVELVEEAVDDLEDD